MRHERGEGRGEGRSTHANGLTNAEHLLSPAYNLAQAAREDPKAKTDVQDAANALLNSVLTAEGSYVQSKSSGDGVKIQSAGMDVRADAAPIGDLPAPGNVSASEGDHDGEIDLHWNRVKGAKSYVVQYTTTPTNAASWVNGPIATKSKATVTGLTSATKYYLRVAGIGAAGQGAFSELAAQVALNQSNLFPIRIRADLEVGPFFLPLAKGGIIQERRFR